ncbi:sulfurtransferase complex subunit TusB [Methylobacter sp. YRD-M1]|uniref:sulfurtransferase complex subunit TusB n=1 Tax=Methylobacter sp. YRD-M1 TaxID=2911520 RepID=UPI00227CDC7F|nr:sulfurtransferase complex subunit TusB [Methylobacter sp. YRD-M1]WAK01391.1 sulfurtransferase complex subunit TusB [Methylobacter sp. YRD-M1]
MLHLVFQSPIETAILERIEAGDVVVFLENAVLRVLRNGLLNESLTQLLSTNRLCVLSEDVIVRGIAADELVEGIDIIDYAGLVELTVNNRVIQSWA